MPADLACFSVADRIAERQACCFLLDADAIGALPALGHLAREAFSRGAKQVFFAVRGAESALPAEGFWADGVPFSFHADALLYEKALEAAPHAAPRLRLKPRTAGNAQLYLAMHEAAFWAQPLAELPGDALEAGFFLDGGLPCGVYALAIDGEAGEIASIAIDPSLRGRGYGARALSLLEHRLIQAGCRRARLTVLSDNRPALALYARAGYQRIASAKRWYLSEARPDAPSNPQL